MTSIEEYHEMIKPSKSKYKNVRVTQDGIKFDSKAEFNRYVKLRMLEKAREISELTVHPKFILEEAFTDIRGERHRAEHYVADFQYTESGKTIVEDVKGKRGTVTRLFLSKRKRFIRRYPNHELRIID